MPIGLSPNIEGNPDYEIVAVGKCENLIDEVLPLVEKSADKPLNKEFISKSYLKTSKCQAYDSSKPIEVIMK